MAQDIPSYGGQAVLEGVVMRGPRYVSLSVRKPDGEISSMTKEAPAPSSRGAFMRVPVIRGAFAFWDSLSLGVEMLARSAEIAAPEEAKMDKKAVNLGVALGGILAVVLFIMLPAFIAPYVVGAIGVHGRVISSAIETVLRLGILVGYIALVFRMPEIQRVLMYHGAEHKTIWAWEKNYSELAQKAEQGGWDIDDVAGFLAAKATSESRLHPRCGTSFLFIAVLCTWVVFLFIQMPNVAVRIALRLALLPVAAGLSYEVLKASANRTGFIWRALRAPGMGLQKLTTREPDQDQLQVAALSLAHLLEAERGAFS